MTGDLPDTNGGMAGRLRAYRTRRRASKARRSRARRWLTRTGIAVVLLIVIVVGGTAIYSSVQLGKIKRDTQVKNLVPHVGNTENILLIGSTDRCAVTNLKSFEQQCAAGVNGINSDIVIVVRINPSAKRITLLSIPRDTFVPDARVGGLYNKIDAALDDGPDQLAAAIEQDFGIPINHYVELNFGTFNNVVNALGGINMYFPDRLYDANSGLDITKTGCLHLNGLESLELVRSRHLYYFTAGQTPNFPAIKAAAASGAFVTSEAGGTYDGTGDLGRITRVHLFLKVLAGDVQRKGLGNPITDNSLIDAIAPNLTVDSTLGDSELLHIALDLHGDNLGSAPELTAPIVVDAAPYEYKGYGYGDVVFPTEPQDQAAVDQFMGSTPPGLKISPTKITVSVIDGTGSAAATAATASQLHALGYPIVATTATNYVGPVSETTVIYAKGHLQDAERVMSSLTGTVVLGEGTPAGGADVSVNTGTDFSVATPSSATTASFTTAGTSGPGAVLTSVIAGAPVAATPVTVTTTTNPNLAPPTSATPQIAPWDPRACP